MYNMQPFMTFVSKYLQKCASFYLLLLRNISQHCAQSKNTTSFNVSSTLFSTPFVLFSCTPFGTKSYTCIKLKAARGIQSLLTGVHSDWTCVVDSLLNPTYSWPGFSIPLMGFTSTNKTGNQPPVKHLLTKFSRGVRLCANNVKLTLLHQPAVTRLCADKVKLTPLHQPAVNHHCYQRSKCMALESSIRQTGNLQTLLHNFCLTEMTCSWHKNQKHATSLQ